MANENQNQQRSMEVELDAEVAQGKYSNLAIITHSPSEFILDFAAVLPGIQKAKVKSRIILTPEHAKALMLSLQENISRYERNIGEIKPHKVRGPQGGGFNMGQA